MKRFAELEQPMVEALRGYCEEVKNGTFPTLKHAFARKGGPKKVARLY